MFEINDSFYWESNVFRNMFKTNLMLSINLINFCRGNTPDTRGTAFVVYEDIFDAKNACDHLSGFNVCNRYLVVLYYQVSIILIFITY